MKSFKFFQKVEPLFLSNNRLLTFDADMIVINYLRYRRLYGGETAYNDLDLREINYPFNDFFIRVTTWRTLMNYQPEIIEIDYKIIENRADGINYGTVYTLKMHTHKLMNLINENI